MNKYRKEKNNIWTINVVHAAAEKVQFAVNKLKLLHPFWFTKIKQGFKTNKS